MPFLGSMAVAGNAVLLDTCVYIDQMQGRTPKALEDLLELRVVNHSMVAVQEMLHLVGALDPGDPRTASVIGSIELVVNAMAPHRVYTPDADVLASAAVHAGMMCRNQGYTKDNRFAVLHDCVLFLQALKLGFTLVTRNIAEFDYLLQLRPEGRVLFYEIEG